MMFFEKFSSHSAEKIVHESCVSLISGIDNLFALEG